MKLRNFLGAFFFVLLAAVPASIGYCQPRPVLAAPKAAAPDTVECRYHVVQSGDWLSKIAMVIYNDAKMYGPIAVATGLKKPDLVFPGDTLWVPLVPIAKNAVYTYNGRIVGRTPAPAPSSFAEITQRTAKIDMLTLQIRELGSRLGTLEQDVTKIQEFQEVQAEQKEAAFAEEIEAKENDGLTLGTGVAYGSSSEAMTSANLQYRHGKNAIGVFADWNPQELHRMPWSGGGFYRRYLVGNSYATIAGYGGGKLDANDFRSWQNTWGAGAGLGYDLPLWKWLIFNTEYQYRREFLFEPGEHDFNADDHQVRMGVRLKF